MTEDFTTKYKPTTLEEYYCDDELKGKIQSYIDSDSRKPLIFYGPAGTGKTTLAQVICNEMGAHMYNVNGSMENGVDKIREDVVTWARNTVIGSNGLKMIFFDEADRLCFPNDTKVLTGNGRTGRKMVKIQNLSQEKYTPMLSVNEKNGKIEPNQGKLVDSGEAEFFKLCFDNGKEVVASPKHPFFHYVDGKITKIELQHLSIGDKILDFEKDLELKRCEICDTIITKGRFCSMDCKNDGHSRLMKKNNPSTGNEAWNHGLTKYDERVAAQANFGIDNCNSNPEVLAKKSASLKARWNALSKNDRLEQVENSLAKAWENRRGKTYEEFFGDKAYEERAKRSIYGVEGFKDSNYKRYLDGVIETECELCNKIIKVGGLDGIYVHHIDGNHYNNIQENLMNVCPRCHNMVCHNVRERFLEKGWKITHVEGYTQRHCADSGTCPDGVHCPEEIKIISKEFVKTGKAWNVTMKGKNKNFFLSNGILTHNTTQAQDALKRTIDDYSKNTIFVFCTNNIHKIIEPLKSRANTTTFQIGYTSDDVIRTLLLGVVHKIYIDKAPDVSIDIDVIVKAAHGEPRHAINLLQSYVDGSFTVPVDSRSIFQAFMIGIVNKISPIELIGQINEDDLDGLSKHLFEGNEPEELVYGMLKIIADTDRAMQHSINKDVHLLNMIIRLSEL